MRTGHGFTYRFVRISDRGTEVAIVGVGGAQQVLGHSGRGRSARSVVVVEEGDTFAFSAALSVRMLPKGAGDLHAVVSKFDGDLERFTALQLPTQYRASKPATCVCRLAPTWRIGSEIEYRFAIEVLGKKPEALKFLEPPAIWARETPFMRIFTLAAR